MRKNLLILFILFPFGALCQSSQTFVRTHLSADSHQSSFGKNRRGSDSAAVFSRSWPTTMKRTNLWLEKSIFLQGKIFSESRFLNLNFQERDFFKNNFTYWKGNERLLSGGTFFEMDEPFSSHR